MGPSLWGEEFSVPAVGTEKKLLNKIKKARKDDFTDERILLAEKMKNIEESVYRILGHRKSTTKVIKSVQELEKYFDRILSNKIVALDTETNNSLDPITCKLMGLCLYTPGEDPVYIPVNHVNLNTRERLDWQVTEEDIKNQLNRILENVFIIFHNAKFDYQVIKCTCGVTLPISWDTLIGARVLDENESASLKEQYILHINPEQEKYSIEKLFEKEEYAIFDAELFALYAATDAVMTYELYEYQKKIFDAKENKKLRNLFLDVEVPCIQVVAEMELTGVEIDLEYCERLSKKYHMLLDEMSKNISEELHEFDEKIRLWRLTPEANYKEPKQTKSGDGFQKSKSELLENPVNLGSSSQLAILLYDVLEMPIVDPKKPRGTGKDELKAMYSKTKLKLCNDLLEWKKLAKLVDAFIDSLPQEVNKKTNRIHCNYQQIGAGTGRFSCTNPNLQQIPSKSRDIRMMFRANTHDFEEKEIINDEVEVFEFDELLTESGYVCANKLKIGDTLLIDEEETIVASKIIDIVPNGKYITIKII